MLFVLGFAEIGLRIAKPLLLPPLPPIPQDALRAILCIGDSVTQGVGTDEGRDPWPVQLKSGIAAEHRPDVRVLPLGRAGAGVRYLPEVVYPVMEALPSTTRPLALVMLGHNDFLRWEDYERQLAQHPAEVDRPHGAGSPLVVMRLLEWATSGTQRQHYDPSPELLGWFHRGLGILRDRVRARGGEMWLMTYLVPGAPTPGMNPKLVDVLRYARPGEAVINEEIRRTALLLDVPLIDVEH